VAQKTQLIRPRFAQKLGGRGIIMTEHAFAGSPTSIRIVAMLLLALIVICFPFALMMAGMSLMAFDSGVSNEATWFVSVMWFGVLAILVAGVLALVTLFIASRKLLIWAIALTALPVVAVVAMFVVASA
jgi:hypothetical protein